MPKIKRVPISQVRLGMHIHALEGSWIDHPFWKTRFVLTDPDDLRKLRESGVSAALIDVSLGLDVGDETAALPTPGSDKAARQAAGAEPARPQTSPASQSTAAKSGPSDLHTELGQAHAIVSQARPQMISMFAEARLGKAVDATACLPLVNDIADSVFRNPGALVNLARLKSQDDYTYLHSVAVCALMVALGRELGHDEASCREVGMAGLLHDLGKAAMPLEVLNKPGKLTDEEFGLMKTHPQRGHEMLMEGRSASALAMEVCLHHHERFNGSGYPDRQSGEGITLQSRMGAVCDVYDAITSDRPYKAGWDPAESIARMATWDGHFDPQIFQAFVRSLGIYPLGSLVRLQSGRLAVVVEQHPQSLVTPVVKAVYSTRSQMPMTPQRIDLARTGDRIVARENPQVWGFKDLDRLWTEPR